MIYLTLLIFVKDGKEEIFHQFEDLVIPILKNYNGTLIYRIRPKAEDYISYQSDLPYEIHFLSFECEEDFIDFTKDHRRKSFLHLKEDAISSTLLIKGIEY